jgi:hypothetical protein
MMRSLIRGAMLLLTVPVALQAQGKSSAAKGKGASNSDAKVNATVVFRDPDRPVIRDYFRTNNIVATPLPPGIAKNVMRGKPLPPGIAKKAMPYRLVVLLPQRPGVTFLIIGDRVVAMHNGIVVDVMLNVFD